MKDFTITYSGHNFEDSTSLILSCNRCEWEIDLFYLDTIDDIWNELEAHGDVNHDR